MTQQQAEDTAKDYIHLRGEIINNIVGKSISLLTIINITPGLVGENEWDVMLTFQNHDPIPLYELVGLSPKYRVFK